MTIAFTDCHQVSGTIAPPAGFRAVLSPPSALAVRGNVISSGLYRALSYCLLVILCVHLRMTPESLMRTLPTDFDQDSYQ